jgi:serine/threonine-protein kinase
VIHRDLKPANVMVDGRGNARITDFGLAALSSDLPARGEVAGTPAYMAPEQLTGDEVTPRTDLYALGLLLYELFTGRRRFAGRSVTEVLESRGSDSSGSVTQEWRDLDPEVRAVILRCLEERPEDRPPSIHSVIAALPGGGDPLQAALDAGETPSPEMVAAAGISGELSLPMAGALVAAGILLLVAAVAVLAGTRVYGHVDLPLHPRVLEHRAQEILALAGVEEPPSDRASDFTHDDDFFAAYLADPSLDPGAVQPPPLGFHYRQSPAELIPLAGWRGNRRVVASDPPLTVPGMAQVYLDPRGRLVRLLVVPDLEATGGPPARPDWEPFLEAAGLDPASLEPTEPRRSAPVDTEAKAAWTGSYPESPGSPLRIFAGSFDGSPVWFEVIPTWRRTMEFTAGAPSRRDEIVGILVASVIAFSCVGAIFLARRNLRRRRGDRRGAVRFGLVLLALLAIAFLLRADHLRFFPAEWAMITDRVGLALFRAGFLVLLYLALEPYLRRSWPRVLISWNRLLAGRWRDPLVGRDLLAGTVLGLLILLFREVPVLLPGGSATIAGNFSPSTLADLRQTLAAVVAAFAAGMLPAMLGAFLLLLLHSVLKRRALVFAALCLVYWGLMVPGAAADEMPFLALVAVLTAVALVRHGIIGAFAVFAVGGVLTTLPVTWDVSAWYFATALPAILLVLAMLGYGFRTALRPR